MLKTINEYHSVDKSKWTPGPWSDEPDKIQFKDDETGFACLIVRNCMGALCGYVGVPEGHYMFGKDWDTQDAKDLSVHGGVTFGSLCSPEGEEDPSMYICHIPQPGEPDRVWWVGFDCAHGGDHTPIHGRYGIYRDVEYVKRQIVKLAKQLAR